MKKFGSIFMAAAMLVMVFAGLIQMRPAQAQTATANGFADPAFQTTWNRTDSLVASGAVKRSWYWGPTPSSGALQEDYAEAKDGSGKRLVQYFDKSRMELNDPKGDKSSKFYVTNGLLTQELISGRMQVGNDKFMDKQAADIPLASDSDDRTAPTYASFKNLLGQVSDNTGDNAITTIRKDGRTGIDATKSSDALGKYVHFDETTRHNIPAAFWTFLNSKGPVVENGTTKQDVQLSDPWNYASGLPISEPYWAKVKIAGQANTDVLIQAFERRVITYVPSAPEGFKVQVGNIGQHYYDWRYKGQGVPPTATPKASTPTPAGPPAATATPAPTFTAAPNATIVHFWHTQTRTNAAELTAMAVDFNKSHPNIQVIPEYKGNYSQLLTAVQAAAVANALPELTVGYENWIPSLYDADAVVPFDSYLNGADGFSQADLADIYPNFIETNKYAQYDNKFYSLPFTKSALTMWYNEDLLKQVGASGPPKTWDEFVSISKKVAALGEEYSGFEFENETSMYVAMIYAFGGTVTTADNKKYNFNNAGAQKALQLLVDGVRGGYFNQVEFNSFQDEIDFANKKVAFLFRSSTAYSFIKTYYPKGADGKADPAYDFNWFAAVMPQAAGVQPGTTLYGGNIIMYKTTEAKQAASWQFVKWFLEGQQSARWASVSGYFPVRKSATTLDPLKSVYDKDAKAKSNLNVLPFATRSEPKLGSYQQVRDIISNAMTVAIKGTRSVTDALRDAESQANKLQTP